MWWSTFIIFWCTTIVFQIYFSTSIRGPQFKTYFSFANSSCMQRGITYKYVSISISNLYLCILYMRYQSLMTLYFYASSQNIMSPRVLYTPVSLYRVLSTWHCQKLENIPDEIILRYIGKKGGICTVLLMNWSWRMWWGNSNFLYIADLRKNKGVGGGGRQITI